MDLEDIMLSEVNQTKKDIFCMISYVKSQRERETSYTENRLVVARGGMQNG